MFLGHLSGGYLLSAGLAFRFTSSGAGEADRAATRHAWLMTGLVCSVLPDLDLIYFYTLDAGQHLHHGYRTHVPAFWCVVFAILGPLGVHVREFRPYYVIAAANVFLHLALDSIAAEIFWLHPFSPEGFGLVTVPAIHGWWGLNFLFHWTFALEIALIAAAFIAAVIRPDLRRPKSPAKLDTVLRAGRNSPPAVCGHLPASPRAPGDAEHPWGQQIR